MEGVFGFLSRRPAVSAALAGAFFLGTMVFHDVVQNAVYRFAQWVGRGADEPLLRWNVLITAIGAPLLIAFTFMVGLAIRRHPRRRLLIVYWIATLLLIVGSYNSLFIMNSEIVHFPQFAILAALLFPITGRCGETVFWGGLLGAADEAYQYWWLSREYPIYYDFNDVVLNMIGAGLGVLLVLTLAPGAIAARPSPARSSSRNRSRATFGAAAIICAAGLALAVGVAAWSGVLRMLPPQRGDDRPAIVLRACGPAPAFWVRTPWGKTFHQVSPLEGTAASVLLVVLFTGLDFHREPRPGQSDEPI